MSHSTSYCSNSVTPAMSGRLMNWFNANGRKMPWRGDTDPYRIWVSEVMLQQTQVDTVIPYYLKWLASFPTVQDLADAPLDMVLKHWEGLGYYSRARNMHRCARMLVDQFSGVFPRSAQALQSLPGIGPYISAAVASIAFNEPAGVVDGNVIRVVTRLFAITMNAAGQACRRCVRELVESSYFEHPPRWVNQAWMELGAIQCTPAPDCRACPLVSDCRAHRNGTVGAFPRKPPRSAVPHRRGMAFFIRRNHRLLMVQRPETGLLGGLWEPPNIMLDETSLEEFLQLTGITLLTDFSQSVAHQYSHFKVTFTLHEAALDGEWRHPFWPRHRWVTGQELPRLARPQVHIKALDILKMHSGSTGGSGTY